MVENENYIDFLIYLPFSSYLIDEKEMKTRNVLKMLAMLFHKKTCHCKHKSPDCFTNAA